MSENRGLRLLSLLVLLTGIFAFIGCGDFTLSEGEDYNTLTVKRGIARFSFEFPTNYTLVKTEVRNDREHRYTDVVINGPLFKEYFGDYTSINVFVDEPTTTIPNHVMSAEDSLMSSKSLPDFRLLERKLVTIHSVSGTQLVYFYKWPRHKSATDATVPQVMREVHFDYGGLLWRIAMNSNEATAEADKAVFEHILETFKILD